MSKAKKVLYFIVEGKSEQSALETILSEILSNESIYFHVYNGDITANWDNNKSNIESKLAECITMDLNQNKFLVSDIFKIIHLVDMDGAYIPDKNVKEDKALPENKFAYNLVEITGKERQKVLNRNHGKQAIINYICQLSSVELFNDENKQELSCPYEIYYFSRNLDHVLYDEVKELTSEEKLDLADEFADKFEDNSKDFIAFISDKDFAVQGSYEETWQFIKQGTNSLNRFSNFHLLFTDDTK